MPSLGPLALYAMNILQLWLAGEETAEMGELVELLERMGISKESAGSAEISEGTRCSAPRPGDAEWIEEMEWLELERAGRGPCEC